LNQSIETQAYVATRFSHHTALPTTFTSPSKRKAIDYEEDFENIDPIIFTSPKRPKGHGGTESFKPSQFVLTKASTTLKDFTPCSPVKSTLAHPALQPRSPVQKINTTTTTALSAPAGRSPTRKRIGILSRRKTASSFTRVDPPKFSVGPTVANAPFSIAAALSGTIPSYGARQSKPSAISKSKSLLEPEQKVGWYFDIHEDTVQDTMTNLMEHSTCTLDISSDEETKARRRDERGKENVPPLDDVSQTQGRLPSHDLAIQSKARARHIRRRKEIEEGAIDVDRAPLGEMAAEEFYAEGVTENDVVLVADEEAETAEGDHEASAPVEAEYQQTALAEPESSPLDLTCEFDFSVEAPPMQDDQGMGKAVEDLMMKLDSEAPAQAKLFEPLEKAEEGFEVWESSSAKGDD
jgi:hypothetical protein